MRRPLEKFNAKDIIAFGAMMGCFICILILRKEPAQASTFKDVLTYIVIYYIGLKTEQIKKDQK